MLQVRRSSAHVRCADVLVAFPRRFVQNFYLLNANINPNWFTWSVVLIHYHIWHQHSRGKTTEEWRIMLHIVCISAFREIRQNGIQFVDFAQEFKISSARMEHSEWSFFHLKTHRNKLYSISWNQIRYSVLKWCNCCALNDVLNAFYWVEGLYWITFSLSGDSRRIFSAAFLVHTFVNGLLQPSRYLQPNMQTITNCSVTSLEFCFVSRKSGIKDLLAVPPAPGGAYENQNWCASLNRPHWASVE